MTDIANYRYTRQRTLHLLSELESEGSVEISCYIPPGLTKAEIEKMLIPAVKSMEAVVAVTGEIERATTGAVLFYGRGTGCMVVPPFPVSERVPCGGYDAEPLRRILNQELILALILIRLGAYAIGVFRGEDLVSSKVGTGLIHSRHKKGGSSQRRFERGREKQIEYFFERVCAHVREHVEPYSGQLDYIVYGGERYTLISFRKWCRFTGRFDDKVWGRTLDIRQPKRAALQSAIGDVWSSRVFRWQEE